MAQTPKKKSSKTSKKGRALRFRSGLQFRKPGAKFHLRDADGNIVFTGSQRSIADFCRFRRQFVTISKQYTKCLRVGFLAQSDAKELHANIHMPCRIYQPKVRKYQPRHVPKLPYYNLRPPT